MNLISKILLPDNILLDAESTSKKRVFERVGLLFENNQQIARNQVFDSLFTREKLGSTGLGKVWRSRMAASPSCATRLPRCKNLPPDSIRCAGRPTSKPDFHITGTGARYRSASANPR